MRLIDADELKKDFNLNFGGISHAAAVTEIIDRQPTIDPESLHRERTVATNADRIRSMNDERLADQLVIEFDGLELCRLYLSAPTGKLYVARTEATRNALEWLRQPTEED